MAKRFLVFMIGVVVYLVFFLTTLYEIGFVGNLLVPKGIDDGVSFNLVTAVVIDLMLIAIFGLQHSLMARASFKARLTQFVPAALERSIFVLASSLALLLLFWQWQPVPGYIWNVQNGFMRLALTALFWLGWAGVIWSTFLIDHYDLFGLRQVYLYLRGIEYSSVPFKKPTIYNYIRHPMMLSFLVAFWATPQMTLGHLIFSTGMTVVILIGVMFEERDLLKVHGDAYGNYRRQVSMLIPMPRKK